MDRDKVYHAEDFYSVTVTDGERQYVIGVAKDAVRDGAVDWYKHMTNAIRQLEIKKAEYREAHLAQR